MLTRGARGQEQHLAEPFERTADSPLGRPGPNPWGGGGIVKERAVLEEESLPFLWGSRCSASPAAAAARCFFCRFCCCCCCHSC